MKAMTGPLRKIERAKEHLDLLIGEIKAFRAREPFHISIEEYTDDGGYIVSPYLREPMAPLWGVLVGEISHGLRSALDNIAWQIATVRSTKTEFPIFIDDSAQFTQRLKLLRHDAWDRVKAIQPYNRPDGERTLHPLWILNRLDIIDKHRTILPVLTRVAVASGSLYTSRVFTKLDKGDVTLKISGNTQPIKDLKPGFTAEILFDVGEPPRLAGDVKRLSVADLYLIHAFVRDDVYPMFAHFLKPEDA